MATFIAFLRAVNLGRRRKLPMADARAWLSDAGLKDVESFIQTGNLRFTTSLGSRAEVEQLVEQVLGDACGFDVPTMAVTPAELRAVHAAAPTVPAPEEADVRRYVSFLKDRPRPGVAAAIEEWAHEGEGARVAGRAVHWWIGGPTQRARLSNAQIERTLGPATTRDLKVVTKLVDRWGG